MGHVSASLEVVVELNLIRIVFAVDYTNHLRLLSILRSKGGSESIIEDTTRKFRTHF